MAALYFGKVVALIDEGDLPMLAGLNLRLRIKGSEANRLRYIDFTKGGRTQSLHRHLMGYPVGLMVDHINGDGLDNRRANLRLCTHAQNMQNRRMHSNNAIGIKGVYFDREKNLFRADIRVFGRKKFLGHFKDAAAAGVAYMKASIAMHGQFSQAWDVLRMQAECEAPAV